ncbi:MAG: multiubiquitin domain-containing protein [Thiobacillaceae bacterium]
MNMETGVIEAHHTKVHEIFVNGKPRLFEGQFISYDQVVRLAFPEGPFDIIYTVAYANPHGHDGTLAPGQSTPVHNGMEFRARKTNRS